MEHIMKTVKQQIQKLVEDTLRQKTDADKSTCNEKAISVVEAFFSIYQKDQSVDLANLLFCESAHEEISHLLEKDQINYNITFLVLMVVVALIGVQLVLLPSLSLVMIPFLISINVILLLVGYLWSEYKHIELLEKNQKVLTLTAHIVQEFLQYAQSLQEGAATSLNQREINEVVAKIHHWVESNTCSYSLAGKNKVA